MEEANMINEAYAIDPRSNDRRICICGHSVSRHSKVANTNGIYACRPGRLDCPCASMKPVIIVPNTRYFMRKSLGSGAKHALVRGVAAAIEASSPEEFEQRREWLVPAECEVCQTPAKYYPVRITAQGKPITDAATEIDQGLYAFMCEFHRNATY